MCKTTVIDNNNIKVVDFYNFKNEEWEQLKSKFNVDRISEFSDNKKEFNNWLEQFGYEVSFVSFCKEVLELYELPNDKDLMYITTKESYHLMNNIAQKGLITSRSQYSAFTRILSKYSIWGMEIKKVRGDIITNECFNTYDNLLNKDKMSSELLTKREINTLLYNLKDEEQLLELLVLLTLNGLKTTEIRLITKKQVLEINNNILTMDNRSVYLDNKTIDKLVKFANSTVTMKKTKTGYKENLLKKSDYVVRTTTTTVNEGRQDNPISKNSLSTLARRVFTRIGLDEISLRTIRNSAIVHDYLDNKSILEIQNKYDIDVLMVTRITSLLKYKRMVQILQDKEKHCI
jgi:hypothetical protein